MKKVSLIVPVYNVDKYLVDCLESIRKQEYSNIEVILVNDGSTDNSLEICKLYCNKYQWVLVDKKNGGLSSARNAGLKICSGDYICFLDSDDWFNNDMISRMVYILERENASIVECGINNVYDNKIIQDCADYDCKMSMKECVSAYLLQTKNIHSAVWNKIYRKDVIKDLMFEEGRLHEDGYFMYQALYNVNTFYLTSYIGYNYRQNREGSIMTVKIKPKNVLDVTDLMEKRIQFFRKNNETEFAEMSASYHYRTVLSNYITSCNIIKDKKLIDFLMNVLNKNKKNIFKNKYLKSRKLKFILFFYFKPMFNYIYLNNKGEN